MKTQISDHFNFKKLMQFTIPSIIMMIFSSIYNVVDGYFVSNYTGKTQFAAVNLVMPFLLMMGVIGFMFGTGDFVTYPTNFFQTTMGLTLGRSSEKRGNKDDYKCARHGR